MDTFGARLKSEREDRGLSIDAVAGTLRIDEERLLALERNDFEALPDEAVMIGCLRAYAECLEVDAELMIEDYVQERSRCLACLDESVPDRTAEIAPAAVPSYGDRPRGLPRAPVLVLIAAVVVVAGGWWMLSRDSESPTAAQTTTGAKSVQERQDQTSPETSRSAAPVAQPEVEPTAPRPAPAASPPPSIAIGEYGVGTGINKRELVGKSDRFDEGTQVWFWTRVEEAKDGDRIDHVWLQDGKEAARINLRIGGSPWRTYSTKLLRKGSSGEWAVEARDAEGRLLARQEFACAR